MGLKAPKSSGSKAKSQDDENEEILQAVVVADSFENKFAPFTLERPHCLMKLANSPILEYTFEFLAQSGVREVFLAAGSLTDQVEKYVEASKWRLKSSPFKRCTILKSAATSVGDVMRDLDQKGLLAGDFLVVSGDVVATFAIAEALAKHKARRQKDKNAIMTMLLREIGPRQRSQVRSSIPTFVIDPTQDRCLHYQESRGGHAADVKIDPDMLSQTELEIRQDLVDCRIDICTPEMLSLWSDNFDNQSPRRDFLHGVLKDYELNGKTIHTHVVREGFASRVSDFRAYETLTRDIISRWTFPACPDANSGYSLSRQGVYKEDSVTLAKSCRVTSGSVLGRGTSIGHKSIVHNSVIGNYCRIGKNANIRDAYIWDYAIIEDDARVVRAIIADEAVIGKRCIVGEGSLISYGVRIGQGQSIENGSRITRVGNSGGEPEPFDKDLVGGAGEGYAYVNEDEEEAEIASSGLGEQVLGDVSHECSHSVVYKQKEFASSNSSISSSGSQGSEPPSGFAGSRSESFATTVSDDDSTDRFHHEAVVSLFERMKRGTDQDDVRVELMGLRFAQNATEHQVRRAVAVALMKHISNQIEEEKVKAPDALKDSITRYRSLIQRDQGQETAAGQVDFLLEAQRDLIHRKEGDQILLHLAKELYSQDLFEEHVFSEWWNDDRSRSTAELQQIREPSKQFLDWLADADEESDSGSEEE